jgi:hypothetical protein
MCFGLYFLIIIPAFLLSEFCLTRGGTKSPVRSAGVTEKVYTTAFAAVSQAAMGKVQKVVAARIKKALRSRR